MDEPLLTDPHRLAASLADELLAAGLRLPYALFGHSLGALLAFELAHTLLDRGAPPPVLLVASGTEAPAVRDDSDLARPKSDEELIDDLRRLRGTPEEALCDADLMRIALPVLRADFLLCGHYGYRPRPALPCPVHVFGGRQDDVDPAALRAWERETSAGFVLRLFEGDHFFIHSSQREVLSHLAAGIADRLGGAVVQPVL